MALPVMRSIKQWLEKIEMKCPLIFDVLALVCLFKDRVCLKAGVLACCSKRSRQCEKKSLPAFFMLVLSDKHGMVECLHDKVSESIYPENKSFLLHSGKCYKKYKIFKDLKKKD